MGKAEQNKLKKRTALLAAAYELFTTKGSHNTSISEITEKAGVAKGTYYLYFEDKQDINNKLLIYKTSNLVDNAVEKMKSENESLTTFKDRLIFVANDIIDTLANDKVLLSFITRNLGLGFFREEQGNVEINNDPRIHAAYEFLLKDIGEPISNSDVMFYMIIELVGSSIYSSILRNQPLPIEDFKPFLFEAVLGIVDQFTE